MRLALAGRPGGGWGAGARRPRATACLACRGRRGGHRSGGARPPLAARHACPPPARPPPTAHPHTPRAGLLRGRVPGAGQVRGGGVPERVRQPGGPHGGQRLRQVQVSRGAGAAAGAAGAAAAGSGATAEERGVCHAAPACCRVRLRTAPSPLHPARHRLPAPRDEDEAARALQGMQGRYYAGKPIVCEFSPVTGAAAAGCWALPRWLRCSRGCRPAAACQARAVDCRCRCVLHACASPLSELHSPLAPTCAPLDTIPTRRLPRGHVPAVRGEQLLARRLLQLHARAPRVARAAQAGATLSSRGWLYWHGAKEWESGKQRPRWPQLGARPGSSGGAGSRAAGAGAACPAPPASPRATT